MGNDLNTARKFLAPIVFAPAVVAAFATLPAPWNTVAGAVLTILGVFVNWGHLPPPGGPGGNGVVSGGTFHDPLDPATPDGRSVTSA